MEISSQSHLRAHGTPDFCYLCGDPLANGAPLNRDHCPPKSFFALVDRVNYPLILPTHQFCNNSWHEADEQISILADALHSNIKNQKQELLDKLDVEVVTLNGQLATALTNFPLSPMTGRIIRGMHALLYHAYLPPSIKNKFHAPLPEAEARTRSVMLPLEQTFAFSKALRMALTTGTAEVIRAYNGKFQYACTWEHLDDGTPFCIFAFDIYRFHALSPPLDDFPRAFIGMYIPEQLPEVCSWAPRIEMEFSRDEILHPLAQT